MARPKKDPDEIFLTRKYRLDPGLIERFEKSVPAGKRSKVVTFAIAKYLDTYYPESNLATAQQLPDSEQSKNL